jgi:hypothetical protein
MIVQRITSEIVDMTELTRKEKRNEDRNNSLLFGRANLDATEKNRYSSKHDYFSSSGGATYPKTMFSVFENA